MGAPGYLLQSTQQTFALKHNGPKDARGHSTRSDGKPAGNREVLLFEYRASAETLFLHAPTHARQCRTTSEYHWA
jgi:hypothetical protein